MFQFYSETKNDTMSPLLVAQNLAAFRLAQDVNIQSTTVSRPHNSILTVVSSIGGFALALFLVQKLLMACWMSCMWHTMVQKVFVAKPKNDEEKQVMRRRVERELNVKNFIRQAILTRKLVKDNMTPGMQARLKLDVESSDDEIWGSKHGTQSKVVHLHSQPDQPAEVFDTSNADIRNLASPKIAAADAGGDIEMGDKRNNNFFGQAASKEQLQTSQRRIINDNQPINRAGSQMSMKSMGADDVVNMAPV